MQNKQEVNFIDKKYPDLYALMKDGPTAKHYFDSLPERVRLAIAQCPGGIDSLESLRSYADDLTQGDR